MNNSIIVVVVQHLVTSVLNSMS